jgi:plasmid replication initiation protein
MKKKELADPSQIKIIRKANELVEARYRFDIWEMRVFAKMLMSIKTMDKDLQKYHIHISEIIKDFNLSDAGDNYASIKDAANKLLSKVIEIEKESPGGGKWLRIPLLIAVEGFKNKEEGNYISVQFHPELKPFLMELKERYLQYDIRNLWGLTSVYSVRMYELLKQYERIGKRHFDLENLRLILGINPDEYKLYGHFKSKVILKAQTDLKEVTDIHFTFKEKKDSRRVVGLTFQILQNKTIHLNQINDNHNNVNTIVPSEDSITMKMVYEQVKEWGISLPRLRKLFIEFGENQILGGLQCTLDALEEGKIKGSKAGFFTKAVEENWKSPKQILNETKTDKQQDRQKKVDTLAKELKKCENELNLLLNQRSMDVNHQIKILTKDDPLIATEAINKITTDGILVNILEKQTALKIKELTLDDWRYNEDLKQTVVQQIELMHSSVFEPIQQKYDTSIKRLKRRIAFLENEMK